MEKKITGRLATIGVPALLLGATLTVLMAAPAFAATDELTTVIDNLRNWAMGILAAVATLFLTIGGVRYLLAGGNPRAVEEAKGFDQERDHRLRPGRPRAGHPGHSPPDCRPLMPFFNFGGLLQSLAAQLLPAAASAAGLLLFQTPAFTEIPDVRGLWQVVLGVTDTMFVLALLFAGGLIMTSDTFQSRYTAKLLIPRLLLAAVLANASLVLCSSLTHLDNALVVGILGPDPATNSWGDRDRAVRVQQPHRRHRLRAGGDCRRRDGCLPGDRLHRARPPAPAADRCWHRWRWRPTACPASTRWRGFGGGDI